MSDRYQATIRETALGSIRASHRSVAEVFIVGPQECTHHLTPGEAREAAAALTAVADELEAGPAEPAQQAIQVMEFGRWLKHYQRIHGRSFK